MWKFCPHSFPPPLVFFATPLRLCLHACVDLLCFFCHVGLFNEWARLVLDWKVYPADNARVTQFNDGVFLPLRQITLVWKNGIEYGKNIYIELKIFSTE